MGNGITKPDNIGDDPIKRVRHKRKRALLMAIAGTANIVRAAQIAEVSRESHYEWLRLDPLYREAFAVAMDRGIDALEAEAGRRAFEGVQKPVYHAGKRAIDVQMDTQGNIVRDAKGNAVGVPAAIREYSDSLMMFLLKGKRPQVYRDNVSVDSRFIDKSGNDRDAASPKATRAMIIAALEGQSGEVKAAVARKLLEMGQTDDESKS